MYIPVSKDYKKHLNDMNEYKNKHSDWYSDWDIGVKVTFLDNSYQINDNKLIIKTNNTSPVTVGFRTHVFLDENDYKLLGKSTIRDYKLLSKIAKRDVEDYAIKKSKNTCLYMLMIWKCIMKYGHRFDMINCQGDDIDEQTKKYINLFNELYTTFNSKEIDTSNILSITKIEYRIIDYPSFKYYDEKSFMSYYKTLGEIVNIPGIPEEINNMSFWMLSDASSIIDNIII